MWKIFAKVGASVLVAAALVFAAIQVTPNPWTWLPWAGWVAVAVGVLLEIIGGVLWLKRRREPKLDTPSLFQDGNSTRVQYLNTRTDADIAFKGDMTDVVVDNFKQERNRD